MRFSFSAVFLIAVAVVTVDAAVIPRRRSLVNRMEDAADVAVQARAIPEAAVPPVVTRRSLKRLHARDFKSFREQTA